MLARELCEATRDGSRQSVVARHACNDVIEASDTVFLLLLRQLGQARSVKLQQARPHLGQHLAAKRAQHHAAGALILGVDQPAHIAGLLHAVEYTVQALATYQQVIDHFTDRHAGLETGTGQRTQDR